VVSKTERPWTFNFKSRFAHQNQMMVNVFWAKAGPPLTREIPKIASVRQKQTVPESKAAANLIVFSGVPPSFC